MSQLARPIFVVGCPRSGTTLVQCILSVSSEAFSLPETHFFSAVRQALGPAPTVSLARTVFETEAELTLPSSFWAQFDPEAALDPLDLFRAVVEQYRPAAELRAIEKTPRHVLQLDVIGETFADAVFVNVIRDPIDVASSLLGVPFESSRSMLSYAQRWTESVDAARAYDRRRPGRLQTVVYERLVREPEATVRALCSFVDLPYEPVMLAEFGREADRNVGRGEAWKRDVKSGVILDRQGVWRTRLTPGQAWLVAQATRARRREYGYVDGVDAAAGSIAEAIVAEARVRFHEARASTGIVGAARHAGSVLKTLSAA